MTDATTAGTPLERARAVVCSYLSPVGTRDAPLDECDGAFASRAVQADHALPRDTTSTRDGYAVRAADTANAAPDRPIRLRVLEQVATAGAASGASSSERQLDVREAMRVMTGALLPAGADAVVPFEELEDAPADTLIVARHPVTSGRYLRPAASEVPVGEPVVARGEQIGPAVSGFAAALGHATLPVYLRPRATVIAIGDELLEPGAPAARGRLYNDGARMLASMLRDLGLEVTISPPIADTRSAIRRSLERAAADRYDLLLTTGGTGGGDHDLIRSVLSELAGRPLVPNLALRPGGGTIFTKLHTTPCFALPGTPGAAIMVFELLVRPAARILLGSATPENPKVVATLADPLERGGSRSRAAASGVVRPRRMQLYTANAELRARPVPRAHLYRELRESNAVWLPKPGAAVPSVGDSIELELSGSIPAAPEPVANPSEKEQQ